MPDQPVTSDTGPSEATQPAKPSLSLSRRLFLGAIIWSLIVVVGGVVAMTAAYRTQTVRILQQELDSTLITLPRALEILPDGRVVDIPERLPSDSRFQLPLSGRYWAMIAVQADGSFGNDIRSQSVWDGPLPLPRELADAALAAPGVTQYGNTDGPNDERLRVAVRSITVPNRENPILLMAAADRAVTDEGANQLRLILLTAMATLAGGTLLALWIGLRMALRPFDRVQAHIAEISDGQRARLDGEYPAEVLPLTDELNKLLDSNRKIVERSQTHVGNLAHALKTPLAVLRNEATGETGLDDVVRRQTESMRANVEHYLKRAQAAARSEALGVRTEIAPVAAGLARLLNRLFETQGISVSTQISADRVARIEQQDLEEMLGNLMENACKWANSRVEVSCSRGQNGFMQIHIDDDGKGLAPEAREAALQRGVRLDETAPGTGLGLSIVADISEMNGGRLDLSESPLGGLRATITLRGQ
ncbi:ATP-binding protein [Henriciella marina]|uniref:histidine kinase n=1 Tax=Henriciella marina TaxID=453851 RepID=A0ABT4LUK7_9PROT|nr:ATP-binding protein [Henriciella marina]MCZ4297991.1 ATP-binding protein [Henriciella marina]